MNGGAMAEEQVRKFILNANEADLVSQSFITFCERELYLFLINP